MSFRKRRGSRRNFKRGRKRFRSGSRIKRYGSSRGGIRL